MNRVKEILFYLLIIYFFFPSDPSIEWLRWRIFAKGFSQKTREKVTDRMKYWGFAGGEWRTSGVFVFLPWMSDFSSNKYSDPGRADICHPLKVLSSPDFLLFAASSVNFAEISTLEFVLCYFGSAEVFIRIFQWVSETEFSNRRFWMVFSKAVFNKLPLRSGLNL